MRDLKPEDFMIYEDGVPQKIVNFRSERVPVKVVLLVDASGSTRQLQGDLQRAALEFVKRLEPEDAVAVITFNYQPKLVLNWSNNLEDVQLALQSIYARGQTVLNDAIFVAFDDLLRDVEGKTAVILLTDGIDTGSMVSFDRAIDLVLRSDTIVYVVSKLEEYWASAIQYRYQLTARGQLIPEVLKDDYILERKRGLNRVASLTGGRIFDAQAFATLTDIYSQVADELKNQYYISYVPTNRARDGTWRNIEVRLNRGGVAINTRKGYYAPSPVSSQ